MTDRGSAITVSPFRASSVTISFRPKVDKNLVYKRKPPRISVAVRFVIGSVGKTFTATALPPLADQGLVELDAPVRRYAPEFAGPGVAARVVTVAQLLNYTAGSPPPCGDRARRTAAWAAGHVDRHPGDIALPAGRRRSFREENYPSSVVAAQPEWKPKVSRGATEKPYAPSAIAAYCGGSRTDPAVSRSGCGRWTGSG